MNTPPAHSSAWLVGFSAAFVAALLAGCSPIGAPNNEVVMCPNSSLSATVGNRTFSIRSTSYLTRELSVDGATRTVTLIPRRERLFGSFGLYTADGGDSHEHILMEEGIQHFSSLEDASDWLVTKRRELPIEYTSDGLVIAGRYQVRPPKMNQGPEAALTVQVWILLVNGSRLTQLAGAHDELFKAVSLAPQTCSTPKPFVSSREKTIDGRRFSGRAIDIMNERGFTAHDIEQLIKNGERMEEGGRVSFLSRGNTGDLFFVDTRADGSVIDVG